MTAAMLRVALSTFALIVAAVKVRQDEPADPVQKVLLVLKNLKNQSIDEGGKEAAQYKKFFKFCNITENEKIYQIGRKEEKIKRLAAHIEVLQRKIEGLDLNLKATDDDLAELNNTISTTNADRDEEKARYEGAAAEMDGAISALDRAIKTLLLQKDSLEGKVGLAQISKDAGKILKIAERLSLLQLSVEQLESLSKLHQTPAVYNFQAGDIIAMLKGLLSTFKQNKMTLDMTEQENKLTYAKMSADLNSRHKFTTASFAELTISHKEKTAELAATETSFEDETAANKADKAFLAALQKDCKDKSDLSWRRLEARDSEQRLLDEAIEKVQLIPGGVPKTGAFIEKDATEPAPSFMQVEGKIESNSSPSKQVVDELKKKTIDVLKRAVAKLGGGRSLILAQERVKAVEGADPFVKLRKIFNDLIGDLEAARSADQTKEADCADQINQNLKQRDDAQAKIETLNSDIVKDDADKNQTMKDVNKLLGELNTTTHELSEETALRAEMEVANAEAIKVKEAAAEAVKNVVSVYKPTGKLIQLESSGGQEPDVDMRAQDSSGKRLKDYAPKVVGVEYSGGDKVQGVIGILEKVYSDFTKEVMEMEQAEKASAEDYEEYKREADKDIAAMNKEIRDKKAYIKELKDKLETQRAKKAAQQELLDTALEALEELKTMCTAHKTYEEKREARQQEIDSLKDAVKLLEEMIEEAQATTA